MVKIRHLGRVLLGLATLFALSSTPASASTKAISNVGTAISNSSIASTITANGSNQYYILRRGATGTAAGKSISASLGMGTFTIGSADSYNYVVQIEGDETNGYSFKFASTSKYLTSTNSDNGKGTSETITDAAKFTIKAFTGGSDGGTTADTYIAISGFVNTAKGLNAWEYELTTWDADRGNQAAYEIVPVEISDYYTITYNLTINGSAYKTVTATYKSGENVAELSADFVSFTQPSIVGTTITEDQTVTVACTENLPFKVSSDDATYWYMLDMHSTDTGMGTYGKTVGKASYFWYYDDTNNATLKIEDYASNSTYSTTEEGRYLWKVTGNLIDGFKFYNKYLGDTYTLHKASTGDVKATMTTDGTNDTYKLYKTKTDITNGVCFMLNADGETNYLNKQLKEGESAIWLYGWTDNDAGSTIIFRPVSFRAQSYYTNVVATCNDDVNSSAPEGALGVRTSDAISSDLISSATTANTASTTAPLDDTKTAELVTANAAVAAEIAKITYSTVPDDLTGFFRLVNCSYGKTLSVKAVDYWGSSCPISATLTADVALVDATSILQFVKNGDESNYTIKINGQELGMTRESSGTVYPNTTGTAQYYSVTNSGSGKFYLKNTSGANRAYLHDAGEAVVGWSTDADATYWYIVPATELEVTLNEVGEKSYATTYLPFDISGIADAKAYIGKLNETGNELTATEITTIPATNGVILVSDSKAEKATLTLGTATAFDGTNSLLGTCVAITNNSYLTFGRLTSEGDNATEPGFYYYTGETIPANKAYLTKTTAETVRLNFGDATTGIDAATIFGGESNAPVYDLSGRRVATPVKGGIYLQGGKKFIK